MRRDRYRTDRDLRHLRRASVRGRLGHTGSVGGEALLGRVERVRDRRYTRRHRARLRRPQRRLRPARQGAARHHAAVHPRDAARRRSRAHHLPGRRRGGRRAPRPLPRCRRPRPQARVPGGAARARGSGGIRDARHPHPAHVDRYPDRRPAQLSALHRRLRPRRAGVHQRGRPGTDETGAPPAHDPRRRGRAVLPRPPDRDEPRGRSVGRRDDRHAREAPERVPHDRRLRARSTCPSRSCGSWTRVAATR